MLEPLFYPRSRRPFQTGAVPDPPDDVGPKNVHPGTRYDPPLSVLFSVESFREGWESGGIRLVRQDLMLIRHLLQLLTSAEHDKEMYVGRCMRGSEC